MGANEEMRKWDQPGFKVDFGNRWDSAGLSGIKWDSAGFGADLIVKVGFGSGIRKWDSAG